MAVSTSLDCSNVVDGSVSGVAFEVGVTDCKGSPQSVPKRVRRRLMETPENKPRTPSSLQEIETKLKEADLRRQQFHEWLANKARPKPRSPTRPAHPEDLAQRLEAKLSAAEQKRLLKVCFAFVMDEHALEWMFRRKTFHAPMHPLDGTEGLQRVAEHKQRMNRLELLTQAQMRLAKLHELRQAAKTEVQLRAEREREELESKVESRVQQAETNRMALLEAERQRRAAAQERITHSLLQRMLQEDKDKERMEALHATICQKVAAAEEKRLGLIEAEKTRAHAMVMQARRVAKSVCRQREMEKRKMKEKLEDRLQRAKCQRAEFLRQRGRCGVTRDINRHKMRKHGDHLSRKLARCWRQFQRSRRTTYVLTQEYAACAINHSTVTSLPFEQLAARIQSMSTLQSVKALLARIESRFMLSRASRSNFAKIDHLLKRLSPASKRTSSNGSRAAKKTACQGPVKGSSRESQKIEGKDLQRYPSRVFLCAYMILGHPEAVFSGRGDREIALAEAAARLVPEFESLIAIILDGPLCSPRSRPSSPDTASDDCDSEEPQAFYPQRPFADQLAAFDAAWCSYLYQFVVWKVKDAQSLEEDLIRVACQLEVSMLQKCKLSPEGYEADVSHDSKAIRKQVLEDQQLLRERVLRLSGSAGTARMEAALTDARSKFIEAKENGTPLLSPFSPASFSLPSGSSDGREEVLTGKPKKVARALFNSSSESASCSNLSASCPNSVPNSSTRLGDALEAKLSNDNEVLVNDILHDTNGSFADTLCGMTKDCGQIKARIKSAMENAFWDSVVESLTRDLPDYTWVVGLVKEVREELVALIPHSWKQELVESIDLDLFSQMLESGSQDFEYLSKLLDYALGVVLKLAIPANDKDAKIAQGKLFDELSEIVTTVDNKTNRSFACALVKGLRFILEQIQVLKQEISAARIRALEPLVQGSAGVNYLQEAFTIRYGPSSGAVDSLPLTVQWITSVRQTMEQERCDFEAALTAFRSSQPTPPRTQSLGLPPVTSLRTGGRLGIEKDLRTACGDGSTLPSSTGETCHEIQWNSMETLVRLGMLQQANRAEAANEETTPETLKLNIGRLQKTQNDFQRIVVIATSMLLVRQTLVGNGVATAELDNILQGASKQLNDLLNNPVINIHQIGQFLSELSLPYGEDQGEANQELMTRILSRSLSADDTVFVRVSAAVRSSMRAILLIGKGSVGRSVAEFSLKRIGAGFLIDLLVDAADTLDVMAAVTCQVHGPWYMCI
eukprot:Gb_06651 [translate_table: standard]